ncbi:MAG TPA: hypothetical protein VLM83_11675, partial [Anaerolineales bacterium]|nr:hypothetical protein [Anaerolineales bacterium]
MSLSDIKSTIDSHKNDKPFVLNEQTTGTGAIAKFLEQTGVLEMQGVRILDGKESVSIQGLTSLYNVESIEMTVTFQEASTETEAIA